MMTAWLIWRIRLLSAKQILPAVSSAGVAAEQRVAAVAGPPSPLKLHVDPFPASVEIIPCPMAGQQAIAKTIHTRSSLANGVKPARSLCTVLFLVLKSATCRSERQPAGATS